MSQPDPSIPPETAPAAPVRPGRGARDARPLRAVGCIDLPPSRENASTGFSAPDESGCAGAGGRAGEVVRQARLWLPRRDEAIFGTFLGDVVRQVAPYTEADPVGILVSLMAALGVRLGAGPHIRAGDDPHPLLVWPMLIGHTGTGKKGTAWSAAKRILRCADADFLTGNLRTGLSTGEGIAALFTDDQDDLDDPAAAALRAKARHAALPPGDHRLLMVEPEWAVVMARMRREGNSLSGMLRAAWEGGDLSTMNVTARVARDTHIGLLAHITPGEFREKVSATDMAGGTYNRFLPTAVAMSQALPFSQGTPEDTVAALGADLARRLDQAAELRLLQLTDDAARVWGSVYVEFLAHSSDNPTAVEQFLARAAPNCLRLAGIHAALDGTPHIHAHHLHAAAALTRYAIASAQAVFTTTDPTTERLATWIADAGPTGRTRKEINKDYFKGNTPADEITSHLDRLIETGQVTKSARPRADGGSGRTAVVYVAAS